MANHKKREAAEATGAFGKMSRKKFEKELAKLQVELVRVTPALGFARTQGVLDGRHAKKHRRVKHDFAFSGLIWALRLLDCRGDQEATLRLLPLYRI